ncbi:MAG: hypothetical protein FWH57_01340 [Oscillospiraceae bacterium]|nr:hypothetical protein [Oscillospiraceae bacterium]
MKTNTKQINIRKRIISSVLVIIMTLVLGVPNAGRTIDDIDTISLNDTILSFEHEGAELEKWAETDATLEEVDLSSKLDDLDIRESDEITDETEVVNENEIADETASESSDENTNESVNGSANEDANKTTGAKDEEESTEIYLDKNNEYVVSANGTAGSSAMQNDINDETVEQEEDALPSPNSISGFFWADGNGDLETDWDGLYNGNERPLAGYPVHLYASDDLSSAVATTQTNYNGTYIFEDLAPGSYILGVIGEQIGGIDYLPPVFITSENKFAIDWDISGLPAYTEVIELEDEQSVQDINAGMRLPMGTATYSRLTPGILNDIAGLKKNSYYSLAGDNWVVVKVHDENGPEKALLIVRRNSGVQGPFGKNSTYEGSDLQQYNTKFYTTSKSPLMELALIPTLGDNNSTNVLTSPYSNPTTKEMTMAITKPSQTKDIVFALSHGDVFEWNGNVLTPIKPHIRNSFSTTAYDAHTWLRTRGVSDTSVWEINNWATGPGYIASDANVNGLQVVRSAAMWIKVTPAETPKPGEVTSTVMVNFVKQGPGGLYDVIDIREPQKHTVIMTAGISTTDYIIDVEPFLEVEGYEFTGEWKSPHPGITPGKPLPVSVVTIADKIHQVYLYYTEKIVDPTVDVTITKTVDGAGGDNNKLFEFTVFLTSSIPNDPAIADQTFIVESDTIYGSGATAPNYDTLTLKAGELTFKLKHGQTITIKDVPDHLEIMIMEDSGGEYLGTHTDSEDGSTGFTVVIPRPVYTEHGTRTFDFVNTHIPSEPTVDVTITKKVPGEFGNKNKQFEFEVHFTSSLLDDPVSAYETFVIENGIIDGSGATAPTYETLSLDMDGKLIIMLSHGQAITIKDVPDHYEIMIIETFDNRYEGTYTDSKDGSTGETVVTRRLVYTEDGTRTFDFVNTYIVVPPTGVYSGDSAIVALALSAIVLATAGSVAIGYIKRRLRHASLKE